MKIFTFRPKGQETGTVTAYLQTTNETREMHIPPSPAVILCPGGGYEVLSEREAEPVAKIYIAAGYHVFILEYSVLDKAANFRPLKELAGTIAYIRERGEDWNIDVNQIAVEGFSAGAHLACSLGTLYKDPLFLKAWDSTDNIRPNAMILSYPVISAGSYAHEGSIKNVSGACKGEAMYEYFGLEHHVDADTPPTFLWHTAADTLVPVENSLIFAAELSKHKVPFELHVFPNGDHGMSACTAEVGARDDYNARWTEWSVVWLNKLFGRN